MNRRPDFLLRLTGPELEALKDRLELAVEAFGDPADPHVRSASDKVQREMVKKAARDLVDRRRRRGMIQG